jgi:cytochrome c oxidase assembly factor CtaG
MNLISTTVMAVIGVLVLIAEVLLVLGRPVCVTVGRD